VPRAATPQDVYRLAVPTDPQLSPDGKTVAFTVTRARQAADGYFRSVWLACTDGAAEARRVTMGPKTDNKPRFSPDGTTLAFLSDRRVKVEDEPDRPSDAAERHDVIQIHLLPLDGGEARRLSDLPHGVDDYAWSPDAKTIAVLTSSLGATIEADTKRRGRPAPPEPGQPKLSDFRYIDRLGYQFNGAGFIDDAIAHIWLVDVATGAARKLVEGPTAEDGIVWSPDGTRIAFTANRHPQPDLHYRSMLYSVDVATGKVTTIAGGSDAHFYSATWSPDGKTIVAIGGRHPRAEYRSGIFRFAADGSDAGSKGGTDLLAGSELKPDAGMNSDIVSGEDARLAFTADGHHVLFTAPVDGAMELWQVPLAGDGRAQPKRLTDARAYVAGWTAGRDAQGHDIVIGIRADATSLPEVAVVHGGGATKSAPRYLTQLNALLQAEVAWVAPVERRWQSDGRDIQGWLYAAGEGRQPLALEIHGGPHTLYGWSPVLEWQILAGAGISVLACNPRGSEGYGEAFNRANLADWGDGPMADVMAGVDQAIDDGLADPRRLGVTGGSYGGYLTNWIIGRTSRFRAALTARSVVDMKTLFLTGDISGAEWAEMEFFRSPWTDSAYFESISPLSLAPNVTTPLLIQHSERDLRCTVGQAEALFTVLRTLRKPVRFMRVPDESHELTRGGAPFRRAENLVQVRDWFVHFLVKGGTKLPPVPKARAGR
jgi:dipeptidyl aminopeptidase/acylaminoacyl peptidase